MTHPHFQASVITDSVSPAGVRLITMELVYPRFIHSEFMTHRVFVRNASSSRAIPTARLIQGVRDNPVMPIHWGRNQPGMQAMEELEGIARLDAETTWRHAARDAVDHAERLLRVGAHKQIVNRLLEPFLPIRVVVSATEWSNFFALRRHPDAQPEIRHLADLMWKAQRGSTSRKLRLGEWHLPYITAEDYDAADTALDKTLITDPDGIGRLIKVSVARCARVSYRLHDGAPTTFEKDLELYERLVGSDPKHASPAEHQATPDWILKSLEDGSTIWANPGRHGPLRGWQQHRKFIPNECL